MKEMFLEINEVKKGYGDSSSGNYVTVLNKVSTKIEKGKMCVILGPSGSGKSTLLNAIGGIDKIDGGNIIVDDIDIATLNPKELSLYRRDYLGYIFQFYNLVSNLTLKENIQVCEYLTDNPLDLNELLEILDLKEHKNKFPSQLSGGQQQRCAIARALIKNPKLLLCDEPTGALDFKNSKEILVLLEKINQKYGTTMLIVTHNTAIKDMVHRVIKIKDGRITEDYENEVLTPAIDIEW
jgi:putative ABC transport system ATP-binding protein